MLEKKLHEELMRYKAINKYGQKMIMEQEEVPTPETAPEGDLPPVEDVPADPAAEPTAPLDAPPADDTMAPEGDSTEEIDITDLVNMTKSIKNNIDDNRAEHGQVINKMDDVFSKLNDLEQKLSQMDTVMSKIDQLGQKMETIKEPTPVEKLEMRSLDSFPFSQNPNQFFDEKQGQMKASGKNEYVLTKDEVSSYSPETIKGTFNSEEQEDEFKF